jgi:hypothetical protein
MARLPEPKAVGRGSLAPSWRKRSDLKRVGHMDGPEKYEVMGMQVHGECRVGGKRDESQKLMGAKFRHRQRPAVDKHTVPLGMSR